MLTALKHHLWVGFSYEHADSNAKSMTCSSQVHCNVWNECIGKIGRSSYLCFAARTPTKRTTARDHDLMPLLRAEDVHSIQFTSTHASMATFAPKTMFEKTWSIVPTPASGMLMGNSHSKSFYTPKKRRKLAGRSVAAGIRGGVPSSTNDGTNRRKPLRSRR